jgi:hypothetical protein
MTSVIDNVSDGLIGGLISGPAYTIGDSDNLLEVGEMWTWTVQYLVPAESPNPLLNTATVEGTDRDGDTVSDSDDHSVILLLEFLKQFTDSGALGDYTQPIIINPITSEAYEIKSGPSLWWEVTYSVTNLDDSGHYYTLWDKWGGNLMVLGGKPIAFDPGSKKKEAGTLKTADKPDGFDIDYDGYIKDYLDYSRDISDNVNYGGSHISQPENESAYITPHTGDQQEGTNPSKGKKNAKDGNAYDVDINWSIGWLDPGETATLTVYLAPGINPGGILQFSSLGTFVVNTGPRVRAYLDEDGDLYPYGNNEFQYSWDFTNQLYINVLND